MPLSEDAAFVLPPFAGESGSKCKTGEGRTMKHRSGWKRVQARGVPLIDAIKTRNRLMTQIVRQRRGERPQTKLAL